MKRFFVEMVAEDGDCLDQKPPAGTRLEAELRGGSCVAVKFPDGRWRLFGEQAFRAMFRREAPPAAPTAAV